MTGPLRFSDLRPELAEPGRLRSIAETGLMEGTHESFDRLARLAAAVLGAPVGLLSVVDHERQSFAGATGLTGHLAEDGGTALDRSVCQYVVANDAPLVVGDLRAHEALREHPAVRDGDLVAYAGVPVHDPDGRVLASFCVVDDVVREWTDDQVQVLQDLAATAETEVALRVRARREHLALERLAGVLDSLVDVAVLTSGQDGRVTSANAVAHRFFPLLGSGGPVDLVDLLGRAVPPGRTDLTVEGPDGPRHLGVVRRPLADPHGTAVECLVVALDMTESRLYAGALAAALEEQVRATAARTHLAERQARFITTTSHELRTPVTNILGYTELLQEALEDLPGGAAVAGSMAPVVRNARRLLDLVEHVADFGRIDADLLGEALAPVPLQPVVAEAVAAVRDRHPAVPLVVEASACEDAVVTGDHDLLVRLLVHVLDNAAKFSPPGGPVELAVRREEGTWVVDVVDQGPGRDPDEVDLAAPFARGRAAEERALPGIGLGLAVVEAIARLHGATFELGRAEDGASRARLSLPALAPGQPTSRLFQNTTLASPGP